MRKFFGYVIIVAVLFSFMSLCEAKQKKKPVSTKHKIEFTTRDKFILVGDLYLTDVPSDKPLVVLVHSFSMNAQVWKQLAQDLRVKGFNVLAMDLRGHGRSVYNEQLKVKSRFYFKNDTWQKLPKDVIDSIKYIKANYPKINCDDIIIAGADIGASAATIASMSLKKSPKKMILISPMLEFKGLVMPVKTRKFYNTNIFMVLAKTDRILINFDTKSPAIIKHYPIGGPGNQLLKSNKDAYSDVINFITK